METGKADEKVIWMLLFVVITGVSARVLSESLSAASDSSLLISSLLFSVGALLGFVISIAVRKKGRVIKSAILALMVMMSIFILRSGDHHSDEELVKERWETQQIGSIEFETVDELKRTSSSVPRHLNAVYEKLDLYLDDRRENDRMSCFMDATLVTDTVSINDAFTAILDGMLHKRNIKPEDVRMDDVTLDEDSMSARFLFGVEGKQLLGFGFVHKKGKEITCIWLFPITETFSTAYIDKFESGIRILK